MIKTDKLKLPIYNEPATDKFDLREWNEANRSLEQAYSEIITTKEEVIAIKDGIVTSNPEAELVNARKHYPNLGARLDDITNVTSKMLSDKTIELEEKINTAEENMELTKANLTAEVTEGLEIFDNKIGNMFTLETNKKGSLVEAVNETNRNIIEYSLPRVGDIKAFSKKPDGFWLNCDGAGVDKMIYPELSELLEETITLPTFSEEAFPKLLGTSDLYARSKSVIVFEYKNEVYRVEGATRMNSDSAAYGFEISKYSERNGGFYKIKTIHHFYNSQETPKDTKHILIGDYLYIFTIITNTKTTGTKASSFQICISRIDLVDYEQSAGVNLLVEYYNSAGSEATIKCANFLPYKVDNGLDIVIFPSLPGGSNQVRKYFINDTKFRVYTEFFEDILVKYDDLEAVKDTSGNGLIVKTNANFMKYAGDGYYFYSDTAGKDALLYKGLETPIEIPQIIDNYKISACNFVYNNKLYLSYTNEVSEIDIFTFDLTTRNLEKVQRTEALKNYNIQCMYRDEESNFFVLKALDGSTLTLFITKDLSLENIEPLTASFITTDVTSPLVSATTAGGGSNIIRTLPIENCYQFGDYEKRTLFKANISTETTLQLPEIGENFYIKAR